MQSIEDQAKAVRLWLEKRGKLGNMARVVFTIEEAATRIGIPVATVVRMVDSGEFRAVRDGRVFLITAHQVERYCHQRRVCDEPRPRPRPKRRQKR